MSGSRFFILSGNGFARFCHFDGQDFGILWVRSFAETEWVEAGCVDFSRIEADVVTGRMVEFSPAALLAGAPSPAKSAAARANGAKGGRPRKV
jgi:hypothetical protein